MVLIHSLLAAHVIVLSVNCVVNYSV